jgi:glycine/D-amino acid oxidase-like deaminating enzyme
MHQRDYQAVIIGGGIFGCTLALYLKQHLEKVAILEREAEILTRASFNNQARVHNGYHYPRSLLTALRSRVNYPRFVEEYAECIDRSFEKYYAIARQFSTVSARQFRAFCERVGTPLEPAPKEIRELFNSQLIEDVYRVEECAFDALKLSRMLLERLRRCDVDLWAHCRVSRVRPGSDQTLEVFFDSGGQENLLVSKYVFNCTYSQLNQILAASDLPIVPLKQEFTEVAVIEVPFALKHIGVTVMCGPFFSAMPFPSAGLHTLSHVRYTPHCSWQESGQNGTPDPAEYRTKALRRSNYAYMVKDAQRFLPVLNEARYMDSLWEIKTVLPKSEVDDSRPIFFKKDHGLKNFTSILGGKIDNIYDILDELEEWRQQGDLHP